VFQVLQPGNSDEVLETVLITGGAGFIGSHLADELLARGYEIRALDSLVEQVHGDGGWPEYLDPDVELVRGDVRDVVAIRRALEGVDAVVHFAARVGVGQSMYELAEYADVNTTGTAVLLEALLDRPVRKLVVASSMSVYAKGPTRTRTVAGETASGPASSSSVAPGICSTRRGVLSAPCRRRRRSVRHWRPSTR
jgi:dTDP-L-rhamnose 4-epimerase